MFGKMQSTASGLTLFTFLYLSLTFPPAMTLMVVDCGNNLAPYFPDSRVQHFRSQSMTAFCADSVIGFGLVCGEVAQRIDIVYPDEYTTLLWDAIQYHWYDLLGNCYEHCKCLDIMPETPDRHGAAVRFQAHTDGSTSVNESGLSNHSNMNEVSFASSNQQGYDAIYYCSEHLHGSPSHDDCELVLNDVKGELLHSVGDTGNLDIDKGSSNRAWFLAAGSTPAPNQASKLPIFDLPKTYSRGSCKITFFLENKQDAEEEDWDDLLSVAGDLVGLCASKRRAGGMASQDSRSIKISIYEPNSVQDQMMQLNAGLVLDRSGDAIIDKLDGDRKSEDSSEFLATGEAQAICSPLEPSHCGTPCYRHEDCDISRDYVCALKGVGDLPVVASWEDFRCTFVTNAAALINVTARSAVCSTGRCLLDADGSLFVPGAASDVTWGRGKPASEVRNQSHSNSTLSQPSQTRIGGLNNDLNVTSLERNSTYGHYPAYSLFCPCNCTYVSMACCSSQTVTEDSQYKINMTLSPMNSTMTCDAAGGGWMSTTRGTRMPTATQSPNMVEDLNITLGHPVSDPGDSNHSSTPFSPSAEGIVPIQSGLSSSSNELGQAGGDSNGDDFT